MRTQHGAVDRVAVEAFGGVEFQRVIDAQHVGRADLRHHIVSDQHHDLVEALLSADLLRHGFAEPSQQDAGTSRRAPHVPTSSPAKPACPYPRRRSANFKKNNDFIISAATSGAETAESAC